MARTIDWQRTGGKTQRVTVTEYVEVDPLYAAYHAPINGKTNVPGSSFAWICGSDGRTSLVYTGSGNTPKPRLLLPLTLS